MYCNKEIWELTTPDDLTTSINIFNKLFKELIRITFSDGHYSKLPQSNSACRSPKRFLVGLKQA